MLCTGTDTIKAFDFPYESASVESMVRVQHVAKIVVSVGPSAT